MTSKRFFYGTIISVLLWCLIVIGINFYLDEFGLFGNAEKKLIKIYYNERMSKYLFSFNYIPNNFDGVLIGPSLSDNLNTKVIKLYKTYNASINGGNISEIKPIVDNLLEHNNKVKFCIICLDPYFTKDHGKKTSNIGLSDYWGALGSLETLKLYINKQYDTKINEFGFYDFNQEKMALDPKKEFEVRSKKPEQKIYIDPIAFDELRQVIANLRKHNVKILGYFYPRPNYKESGYKDAYKIYQAKICTLFNSSDYVWDFNTESYLAFRKDFNNYSDGGHLSYQGASVVLSVIEAKLNEFIKPSGV